METDFKIVIIFEFLRENFRIIENRNKTTIIDDAKFIDNIKLIFDLYHVRVRHTGQLKHNKERLYVYLVI